MKYYISTPPAGPFARFIAGVFVMCTLVAVVFFGVIAFAILMAVIFVALVVAWVRAWWLGRGTQIVQPMQAGVPEEHPVIEAEYTVISRKED